ncbi:MAG: ribbon-helix-helix domain-containing protein [Alphaproteobacteria bacterium]|nr:ribbon-helix-helix domain-containing protein [Alphaproteobacteria bacterium]
MLKKSVIIAGRHQTSISLEKEFFEVLQTICKERNVSVNQIVTEIDSNRTNEDNLSAAVRVYILNYLLQKVENHE